MTELELKKKLDEAISAILQYERENANPADTIKRSVWKDDINKAVVDLIQRSHVLGASGITCPRCNGSGRI